MANGERDFLGYGRNPPDPAWPGGALLALNFVLNVEEGSEGSVPDGAGVSEAHLTELGAARSDVPGRDLGAESMFEYGARAGVWRVLRLFEARGLPLTLFACALALERNAELAQAIGESGNDICGHGYRWEKHYLLDEADERERIAATVASIERTTGRRPTGWYCRYAPSLNTRRLLVEEGGFTYDSDSYADELPWWVDVGGTPHLVVPYTLTNNDVQFMRGNMASGRDFEAHLRDGVEQLLAEGRSQPKMMSVGLHARVIGHPARARALARFLDSVAADERIWVAGREAIALHWRARFPARKGDRSS